MLGWSSSRNFDQQDQQLAGHRMGPQYPNTWDPMEDHDATILIVVQRESDEFGNIATEFHSTLPLAQVVISRVYRVQNKYQSRAYDLQKENMERRLGGDANEMRLFHGTTCDRVEAIAQHNFDWRCSGRNATCWGDGAYFAKEAAISHCYTKKNDIASNPRHQAPPVGPQMVYALHRYATPYVPVRITIPVNTKKLTVIRHADGSISLYSLEYPQPRTFSLFSSTPPNLGAGPSNHGAGPPNLGAGPSNHGAGPPNLGAGPSNHGAGPPNLGAGPSNHGAGPSNLGAGPSNHGAGPPNLGAGPSNQGAMPPDLGAGPSSQHTGPPNQHTGSVYQHTAPPNQYTGPPNQHSGPPNQHTGPPNQHTGPPNQHSGPPNQHTGPPNQHTGPPNQHTGLVYQRTGRLYQRTGPIYPSALFPVHSGATRSNLSSLGFNGLIGGGHPMPSGPAAANAPTLPQARQPLPQSIAITSDGSHPLGNQSSNQDGSNQSSSQDGSNQSSSQDGSNQSSSQDGSNQSSSQDGSNQSSSQDGSNQSSSQDGSNQSSSQDGSNQSSSQDGSNQSSSQDGSNQSSSQDGSNQSSSQDGSNQSSSQDGSNQSSSQDGSNQSSSQDGSNQSSSQDGSNQSSNQDGSNQSSSQDGSNQSSSQDGSNQSSSQDGSNQSSSQDGSNQSSNQDGSNQSSNQDGSNQSSNPPMPVHTMFMAKVLVGNYTRGHPSYRKPPVIDPSNPYVYYDSCVDNTWDPKIFVVFDTAQTYPEYIIEYVSLDQPPNQ